MPRTVTLLCNMLCAFCAALAPSLSNADAHSATPPNIVLIVAEDLSPRIGAFGDPVAQTPHIDNLATQGVRYTQAYTASGVCAPSRSALITGVYPQSMGTHQMRTTNKGYQAVPPADIKAFPELLRRHGYYTANSMKKDYQFGEPFTIWDEDVGDYTTPADLALWRKLPKDKPFFAMITLMDTHESRLVTQSTTGAEAWQPLIENMKQARRLIQPVTNPEDVVVPPYYPDVPEVRTSIAQHYDNIHHIDKQVGAVLTNLEADGLLNDTVIIWTTDHGDGLPRAKRSVYDSGLHVPLIIRFPDGRGSGSRNPLLISFVDLAPTLLKLAGASAPGFIQGRDFLSPSTTERQYIYAARDRMDLVPDRVRAVRDNRYKLIRNYQPDLPYFRPLTFRDMFPVMQTLWQSQANSALNPAQRFYFEAPRPAIELYDTETDPYEINNLAHNKEYEQTLQRLSLAMDSWLTRVGDLAEDPEADMIQSMWPNGEQPRTAKPDIVHNPTTGKIKITSTTPGASIGYRTQGADGYSRWQLYSSPLSSVVGIRIEAKAIRYGYRESNLAFHELKPHTQATP